MFPGKRPGNGVRLIQLHNPQTVALTPDDPDLIVLEIMGVGATGAVVALPATARMGKQFKIRLRTNALTNPTLTTHYVDVLIPLPNGIGPPTPWRLFAGQQPIFVYGPGGWIDDVGSDLYISGNSSGSSIGIGRGANPNAGGVAIGLGSIGYNYGVAVGTYATGRDSGVAIGYNTSGSISGVGVGYAAVGHTYGAAVGMSADANTSGAALGYTANGSNGGVAVGRSANGSSNGLAVGYASNGSSGGTAVGYGAVAIANGAALGYNASANNKDAAVAVGAYSKAQRYREMVKSGDFATTTLQQWSVVNWYATTSNVTPTEILLGGTAAQYCVLLNNSAIMFDIQIIAGVTGAGNTSSWTIRGAIKRGANAASTVLVGTPTVTVTGQDAGASAWAVAATADTTNGSLKLSVTGQASTTINWNAIATLSELRF